MRINGSIPSCASQILAVTIRNMLASLGVPEALGKTEINNIDVVLLFADSDEEIVGFDISMQEMSRMYELNALKLHRKIQSTRYISKIQASERKNGTRGSH